MQGIYLLAIMAASFLSPCAAVRKSAKFICGEAADVTIDMETLNILADELVFDNLFDRSRYLISFL